MATFARRSLIVVCLLVLAAVLVGAGPASGPRVPYPDGYREWTHVKSMGILSDEHPLFEQFGGIHHVYANKKGMSELVAGKGFSDGAVLVFDLLEANQEGGTVTEGPRKFVGVMVKDDRYKTTGGWGFEAFARDSHDKRVVTDPVAQCFDCHSKQAGERDFVFSKYRR